MLKISFLVVNFTIVVECFEVHVIFLLITVLDGVGYLAEGVCDKSFIAGDFYFNLFLP